MTTLVKFDYSAALRSGFYRYSEETVAKECLQILRLFDSLCHSSSNVKTYDLPIAMAKSLQLCIYGDGADPASIPEPIAWCKMMVANFFTEVDTKKLEIFFAK